MKPTSSLGNEYHLVVEDEQQRSITNTKRPITEVAAFEAFVKREPGLTHQANKFMKKHGNQLEHCSFYDKEGHTRDGCFKRVGYPEQQHGKNKSKAKPRAAFVKAESSPIAGLTKEQYQHFLKHLSSDDKEAKEDVPPTDNMVGKLSHNDDWIVDSGASKHMTHIGDIREEKVVSIDELPVTIPNGEVIPVKGKGNHALPN